MSMLILWSIIVYSYNLITWMRMLKWLMLNYVMFHLVLMLVSAAHNESFRFCLNKVYIPIFDAQVSCWDRSIAGQCSLACDKNSSTSQLSPFWKTILHSISMPIIMTWAVSSLSYSHFPWWRSASRDRPHGCRCRGVVICSVLGPSMDYYPSPGLDKYLLQLYVATVSPEAERVFGDGVVGTVSSEAERVFEDGIAEVQWTLQRKYYSQNCEYSVSHC